LDDFKMAGYKDSRSGLFKQQNFQKGLFEVSGNIFCVTLASGATCAGRKETLPVPEPYSSIPHRYFTFWSFACIVTPASRLAGFLLTGLKSFGKGFLIPRY